MVCSLKHRGIALYQLVKKLRSLRKKQRYVLLRNLPAPQDAPWARLRDNRDDNAYVSLLGVTVSGFDYLVSLMKRSTFWQRPTHTRGMGPENMCGLVLFYMRNVCHQKTLSCTFGYTQGTISNNLRKGMECFLEVMEEDKYCIVEWPNKEKRAFFASLYRQRYPDLPRGADFIGAVDGFRVPINATWEPSLHSSRYNGKYGHNIGNVIVSGPDGAVMWYAINFPGAMHDTTMSEGLYKLILNSENNCALRNNNNQDAPGNDALGVNEFLLADAAFKRGETKILSRLAR
jgi:hypothetical protein